MSNKLYSLDFFLLEFQTLDCRHTLPLFLSLKCKHAPNHSMLPALSTLFFLLALEDKAFEGNDRASSTCISYSLAVSAESSLTYFPIFFPSALLIMFLFTGLPLNVFHFLFENVSYMGTFLCY